MANEHYENTFVKDYAKLQAAGLIKDTVTRTILTGKGQAYAKMVLGVDYELAEQIIAERLERQSLEATAIDLATHICKNCSEQYYNTIKNFTTDELLQYNKQVMGMQAPQLKDQNIGGSVQFNTAVREKKLHWRLEMRKGYRIIIYYI